MADHDHLLPVARGTVVTKSGRYFNEHFCVKSKVLCSVLLGCFAVLLTYSAFNVRNAFVNQYFYSSPIIFSVVVSIIAVLAPLAGLLADLRYSRFRIVLFSSYCLLVINGLLLIAGITVLIYLVVLNEDARRAIGERIWKVFKIACLPWLVGITAPSVLVFLIASVRFGIDQLQDRPTEDTILFLNVYVWLYYLAYFLMSIPVNLLTYDFHMYDLRLTIAGYAIVFLMIAAIVFLLAFATCVVKFRTRFFLIEPPGVNPYKLVYGVTKFAYQHKVPLRRSAFTYCENEPPSRMDLGKQKYGGPFSTKEVEDVKAFWGIFKVVSLLGPAYMLQFAAKTVLNMFAVHDHIYTSEITAGNVTRKQEVHLEGMTKHILFSSGLLSPFLVVICIPFYLCFIRPYVSYRIPKMLKRMGLGIALIILSLVLSLAMDVAVHILHNDTPCMLSGFAHRFDYSIRNDSNITTSPLYQNIYFLASQHFLSAVTNMLIDVALLEFIFSQSPYTMKGLFLGYTFSISALFQVIAITLLFLFGKAWNVQSLSCGSGFYLMNVVVGILELALFMFVTKRYKYRTVNEPSNEYRNAEEYYSNIQ